MRALVSVPAEGAQHGPGGHGVGDGEALADGLLPGEVDAVRRGSEPPLETGRARVKLAVELSNS